MSRRLGLGEDTHTAGTDQQADDDEGDAVHHLTTQQGDDSGNDKDNGENPKQSGHGVVSYPVGQVLRVHAGTLEGAELHP